MHARRLPPEVSWRMELLGRQARRRAPVAAGVREACWRRVWHFPSEAGAERWNAEWERVLEDPGSPHPALVRMGGAEIQDPSLDVMARLASNVLCEEALAGAPYPFVRVGRTCTLRVRSTPWESRRSAEPTLVFSVRCEVADPDGELIWAADATRQYPTDVVPAGVAELWCQRPWKPTDEIYA